MEAQATDRARRIAQARPVTVYRLVTETIEERCVESTGFRPVPRTAIVGATNCTSNVACARNPRGPSEPLLPPSDDDQIRRCRIHAAAHDFSVVSEFKDARSLARTSIGQTCSGCSPRPCVRGGAPLRAVLVDDLSRLSRDLGNTWQIVFHDLASANVTVVDVTTRMSSDGAGARLTFGAMALVNKFAVDPERSGEVSSFNGEQE